MTFISWSCSRDRDENFLNVVSVVETEIDVNGRMLLRVPVELQKYAEINDQKQMALVGMGEKFEIWNINSWEMRQTGGSLSTEILDVVLPESIKSMSF